MIAKTTFGRTALACGLSLSLLVIGLACRMWDNDQVRVRSAEQAVQMARAEAGPLLADLPVRVEEEQDFWIVRLGPEVTGRTHSYLVSIWDKRARALAASGQRP